MIGKEKEEETKIKRIPGENFIIRQASLYELVLHFVVSRLISY